MSAKWRRRWARWQLRCLLVLGARRRALASLDARLHADPADADARASRAHLLASDGRFEAARADLEQLVHLRPAHAPGWYNLGYVLEAEGHAAFAEQAFRRALDLDAAMDLAWYGLGLSLIRQRRWDDAVAALQRNVELQPMNPFGWYQLAMVHADRHDRDAVIRIIRHLRGFEPRVAARLERETALAVS